VAPGALRRSATRVPTQATTWLVVAPGVALFVSGMIGWRAFGWTRGRHRGQHEGA
jgi:hypothetical protein